MVGSDDISFENGPHFPGIRSLNPATSDTVGWNRLEVTGTI